MPSKLLVAFYQGDNPMQTKHGLEPVRLYLQKKLGMEVEFLFTTDYATIIQAIQSKKVHFAELTPFAYVIATQKPGLVPLVTLGNAGKPAIYHSFIFSNPHTGVYSLDELKIRAKDLTLCFGDPASTSGHLVPRAFLMSIGLDPKTAFKDFFFAGSHAACIMSVVSGKMDVGCSSNDLAYRKLVQDGTLKKEDVNVLWISPPIVNDAITGRNDLSEELIFKVKKALLDIAITDPQAFHSYVSIDYPDTRDMAYVPVEDSSYNGLRRLANEIRDLKFSK